MPCFIRFIRINRVNNLKITFLSQLVGAETEIHKTGMWFDYCLFRLFSRRLCNVLIHSKFSSAVYLHISNCGMFFSCANPKHSLLSVSRLHSSLSSLASQVPCSICAVSDEVIPRPRFLFLDLVVEGRVDMVVCKVMAVCWPV